MLALCLLTITCSRDSETETRTFLLRQITPTNAAALVQGFVQNDSTALQISEDPRAITVTSSKARLDQIGAALAQYDRPASNVKLEFQIIEADGFEARDSAIADVEAALREVFKFRGYRLLTSALVTARAPGSFRQSAGGSYVLEGDITSADPDGGISLNVQLSNPSAANSLLLRTSLLVPDGQTVVVGSSQPDTSKPTIILVVRTRIE